MRKLINLDICVFCFNLWLPETSNYPFREPKSLRIDTVQGNKFADGFAEKLFIFSKLLIN